MTGTEMTEAATRAALIDRQLHAVGWNVTGEDLETELRVESRGDSGYGFTDYALRRDDGRIVAIVEAKRTSRDALAGKEQARLYADAIEDAQGLRPLTFLANGYKILYLTREGSTRSIGAFFSPQDIARRLFQHSHRGDLTATTISNIIVERPYQFEAIRRSQEALSNGNRRLLWVMATGTGKTRVAAAMIDTLIRARWAQRVLFIVDRNSLATQAMDAFREFLPAEPAQLLRTATYDNSKRIYVATLQTMQDFYREFSGAAFDLIVVDECHRSIYNKWQSVLTCFDAYLLGLTATPSDFIDRNTFDFFGCPDRVPTFGYDLDQAVEDGWLVPYEAYHARTRIQIAGIHGAELPQDVRDQLEEQGIDPDDLDFEGTELERRVTNRDTTRLIVKEFFENSVKDPSGNLPGKSILFAISHTHAVRLYEMFGELFPQHSGLAEVIDSHMEDTDSLIRRFKRDSLPRIAISVDMLDTGVDVPSVVNLGFMKPVFSRIKFWQMVGRGTRLVKGIAATEWCPEGTKDSFRILDFWENFARFQLDPDGVEPTSSTPVVVRTFRLLVKAALTAAACDHTELKDMFVLELRDMIARLPLDSPVVREEGALIHQVSREQYWLRLTAEKGRVLTIEVAPLMQHVADVDLAAETFSAHCLGLAIALLEGDNDAAQRAKGALVDDLRHLPIDHPDVAGHRELLTSAHTGKVQLPDSPDAAIQLREALASLMHLREPEPQQLITLDLDDAFQERDWISVGPDAREFDIAEYRRQVEAKVRDLAEMHPAMLRLATGQQLSDEDLVAIETELSGPELYIDEHSLRRAYGTARGSLVALLRHALSIEHLPSREEEIHSATANFIQSHALNANQILFARLFARRLVQVGKVERTDLYAEPFTRLGADVEVIFNPNELNELLELSTRYGWH